MVKSHITSRRLSLAIGRTEIRSLIGSDRARDHFPHPRSQTDGSWCFGRREGCRIFRLPVSSGGSLRKYAFNLDLRAALCAVDRIDVVSSRNRDFLPAADIVLHCCRRAVE